MPMYMLLFFQGQLEMRSKLLVRLLTLLYHSELFFLFLEQNISFKNIFGKASQSLSSLRCFQKPKQEEAATLNKNPCA